MFVRHLAGLVVMALAAQAPVAPQSPNDQEPRVRIQIDVSATIPDDEQWLEIQSRNFVVAGTGSEDDLKKVAADLELIRDTFASFNPRARGVSSVQTTVLVFRNTSSFRWYRPADDSQPEKAKGYVQASADKNYIVMVQGGSIPREIYRDYVRLLIPEAMGPVPLWFREGSADYFSALKVNRYAFGDKRWTRLGTGIDEYDRLLDKKAKLLPFEQLIKVNETSAEYTNPESRSLFLAQSWGVVHYLMSRPGGAAAMQRLFNMLGDGQTLEKSMSPAFGRNAELFEKDFRQYIRFAQSEHQWSGTMQLLTKSESQVAKGECGKMMLVGISVPRIRRCYWEADPNPDPPGISRIPYVFDKTWAEVSPLKARELSESEVWFYRGDLMLHIGRFGEADAYLRRAIQQPPQASRAHTAMGLLQIQQKRYSEATNSLKTAIELDPKNYLAHYHNSNLIRLKGLQVDTALSYDDLEDIHNELLKTIELAPQFAEAKDTLAAMNLIRRSGVAESRKVLIDAILRYPGRSTSWITLASVSSRNGDVAGARWLLTRLLVGAADAESRKAATTLLEGIAPGVARTMVTAPIAVGTQAGAVLATSAPTPNRQGPRTGEKLRGVLTNIECKNGLTFSVKTGGKIVKLHANSAFSVEFIARDSEGRAVASDPVVCGPTVEEGIDATITYRPIRSGDYLGEPLIVEIRTED